MRGLIVLCVTLASVVSQGYNYPSQAGGEYLTPGFEASVGESFNDEGGYKYHQQPLVSKRFFIHSAPEEHETEVHHKEIAIGAPRKNLNIVFIKSPAAKKQLTKVRIIPAVNEDKTAIYVFAKKPEEAKVVAHVDEPFTTTARPEVYFIKYRTNEEAEHAQHSIQSEYDHLGGSTVVSNEGVSPVSSVIGSLDGLGHGAAGANVRYDSTLAVDQGPASTAYLPPVKK